jgi:DNA topoisomerase VI subunit A
VLALVDSDPYGLKILSVYMKGSMNMSYDSRCAHVYTCLHIERSNHISYDSRLCYLKGSINMSYDSRCALQS